MPNAIAYFEIAGPDAAGLASFYASVFDWHTAPHRFPNYFSVGPHDGAGLAGGFRQEAQPERVLYVQVDDLAAALARVVAGGGKVLIPPTNIPGVIHFALFEDPQGNRTGLVV
jgi:predicted enzyme related to lactoylglutathione lyase